jgi:hypothetical protein
MEREDPFASQIETRRLTSSIEEKNGELDPDRAQKRKISSSRAKTWLKKMPSLKQAFIMSQLFKSEIEL